MSVVESWLLLAAPATICAAILGLLDERTVRPLAIGLGPGLAGFAVIAFLYGVFPLVP